MEKKPVTLKNVTLFWPYLHVTNELSGKYQVDICQLSDSQVKGLQDLGMTIRNKDDDRGYFFTAKSAKYPIVAIDDQGATLPDDVVVGNGTKADVRGIIFEWTHAPTKRSGKSFGINIKGLIITDLVGYNNTDATDFSDLEEEIL
jgi:hypothetical protein